MFKMEFDTGNDALRHHSPGYEGECHEDAPLCTEEVSRILFEVSERVRNGLLEGRLYDIDGNHIGEYSCE